MKYEIMMNKRYKWNCNRGLNALEQSFRNWILALIRNNVCNLIPVPKQVLIPILLIWHLVWYCWYDTRSKAMLWYLIFLFWYLFDISALAPVRFFFCWFLFSTTKKKWTKQRYLLFCSKKVYDFTLLWVTSRDQFVCSCF